MATIKINDLKADVTLDSEALRRVQGGRYRFQQPLTVHIFGNPFDANQSLRERLGLLGDQLHQGVLNPR